MAGLYDLADALGYVAGELKAVADDARSASEELVRYREEIEETKATESRMDAASAASTGGMGARSGNTAVTSKGMAKAVAAARRSL